VADLADTPAPGAGAAQLNVMKTYQRITKLTESIDQRECGDFRLCRIGGLKVSLRTS
jgi:hypothetical protein